ncbi:hypothetical protein HJG60_010123 [Phyllostomus discolor]|uniref:Uncharacterized protein n=1 Tax=Phyllostomus discolor TaxID=89673 RepID=A0A834ASD4_9CHIR|nr:hypothetical protein HJG60_010123 [Phyllostomus discolor]
MSHYYHQGSLQLKPLGYVPHKISTYRNIQSLFICKFRSPFTLTWKEMSISRNPEVSSHPRWCTCEFVYPIWKFPTCVMALGLSCWSIRRRTSSGVGSSGFLVLPLPPRSHLTLGTSPKVSVLFITHRTKSWVSSAELSSFRSLPIQIQSPLHLISVALCFRNS